MEEGAARNYWQLLEPTWKMQENRYPPQSLQKAGSPGDTMILLHKDVSDFWATEL